MREAPRWAQPDLNCHVQCEYKIIEAGCQNVRQFVCDNCKALRECIHPPSEFFQGLTRCEACLRPDRNVQFYLRPAFTVYFKRAKQACSRQVGDDLSSPCIRCCHWRPAPEISVTNCYILANFSQTPTSTSNLTVFSESHWNTVSNERKYYQLFTHEWNTFPLKQLYQAKWIYRHRVAMTSQSIYRLNAHRHTKVKTVYPWRI